jgi:hypothetical protein
VSREGRALHAHNKRRHSQRQFGDVKPALAERHSDTMWMGEFISSIQGITEPFGVDSMIALQLGEDRMSRLRQLSSLGMLRMSAYRVDGEFVEYRWVLTESGRL